MPYILRCVSSAKDWLCCVLLSGHAASHGQPCVLETAALLSSRALHGQSTCIESVGPLIPLINVHEANVHLKSLGCTLCVHSTLTESLVSL